MFNQIANVVLRTLLAASLVAGVIATCAYSPAVSAETPAAPAKDKPAAAAETTPAAPPTPSTTTSTIVSSEKRAECGRYAAALSGDPTERVLLKQSDVRALGLKAQDLVTCAAIKQDSDEMCALLDDHDAVVSCRKTRLAYHELRNPQGRSYLLTDEQYAECKAQRETAPFCDSLRAALRAGDADKCPAGKFHSGCQAVIRLDPSLCQGPDAEDCKREVQKTVQFAAGLQKMEETSTGSDREYVRAALGKKDACEPIAAVASDICIGRPPPERAGVPATGESAKPASGKSEATGGKPEKSGSVKAPPPGKNP